MHRYFILCLAIIAAMIAGIFICAIADGQHMKDNLKLNFDKMPYDDSRQKYYDVIIQSVWKAPWEHNGGESSGIYIKVSTGEKSYLVPIAPCWYLDKNDNFKISEKVTILGVKSLVRGRSIILPKYIKSRSGDLLLRNYDGRPFWIIASKNNDQFKKKRPDGKRGPGQGGPPGGRGRPNF